jgi:formyltetrahydrofolate-dependent phosphoribosylglycinamide formyltransferase
MKNIAIFASGSGTNFKSIYHHVQFGEIPGQIVLTVSNNSDSGAIEFAKENNMPTLIINEARYPKQVDRYELLIQTLAGNDVDLICLTGYMKRLPKSIVHKYHNKILNIHPALLPHFGGKGFYGIKVHEAVIASGTEESGVTVHFVDEEYDHGKIIVQRKVKVYRRDTAETLARRVLKVEHKLYPQVVKAFCEDRIVWENNHPIIEVVIEN